MKKVLFFVALLCMGWSLIACPAPPSPTLDIKIDNAQLAPGSKLKLFIQVTNFSLSQDNLGKANQDAMGHYRVYLNDKIGDDFLYEGALTTVEVDLPSTITDGQQIIKVVLYNNDKTQLSPSVEKTAIFQIQSTTGPSVTAKTDKQELAIGDTLQLTIDIQNFKLISIGSKTTNGEGEGHYHISFDDDNPEKDYITSSTSLTQTLTIPETLSPGKHTLNVYLMNNNHTKIAPEVKASIELLIKANTKPTVKVTSNTQTAKQGDVISLTIDAQNFKLVDPDSGNPNKIGEGHYRITVDNQDPQSVFLKKEIRPRVEVVLPQDIEPGQRKIMVHLVNNDGSVLDPPVNASVTVFIEGGNAQKPELTASIDKTEGLAGDELTLTIDVKNFAFKQISNNPKNATGEGHYHIVFDDKDPENDYTYFGSEKTYKVKLPTDLLPGKHKLWIYLMNNDHSLYVPNTRYGIDITVKDGTEPGVSIKLASTTTTVGGQLEATISVVNFKLKIPGGANVAGEGHYHLAIDDEDPEKDYLVATQETTTKFTLRSNIGKGKHKLWVYLMNNDHTKLRPETKSSITFTVE